MPITVPALPDERCPQCGAVNYEEPPIYQVWRVADVNGLHLACLVCGHVWVMQA